MAQDLRLAAAPLLPALDLDRPTWLESLPSWLESRIAAESRSDTRRILRDAQGRQIGEVRTLPRSLMLSGAMRVMLTKRVAELEAALQPGPPETILEHVSRLLNRYLRTLGDDDLAVRAEIYIDVLDGLPGWTVREAVRRWFQGRCGGALKDYDFAPSEARLRQVADRIVRATQGQIICFTRLLAAEPEPEIPEAVRERQAAELRALSGGIVARRPDEGARSPPTPPTPMRSRGEVAAELEQRRQQRMAREAAAIDAQLDQEPLSDGLAGPADGQDAQHKADLA